MLEGTLDDFTLADVLRLVAAARRTGWLDVARDGGSGRLWFRDGAVASAAPGYDRRRSADTPEARIEDLTFDLMRWDLGDFKWAPGPGGDPEASVEVDDLLREVTRRLEELAEIHALVPSEEAVLAWAPQPPEGAVQINITPAEWRVLVLVDGHRPVREIALAAGLDDLDAMKVLFGLASAGLVGATGDRPAPLAPTPGPPEEVSDMTDMTVMSDVSDTSREETPSPPAPEADGDPAVDRSTAARELAGLFDLGEPTGGFGTGAMVPGPPARPRRVEDDDQVTRGLVSRFIDGVKGL